jgi:hypothetical protein
MLGSSAGMNTHLKKLLQFDQYKIGIFQIHEYRIFF